ncbi:MAG TPA: PAS-domain containing protein [Alphaproteobacteria bacterium]|nr:PAS-domain containing protein [Alphaproteobacteria bacterium]
MASRKLPQQLRRDATIALELVAAPLWLWDPSRGRIVWANRAATRLLGHGDAAGIARKSAGAPDLPPEMQLALPAEGESFPCSWRIADRVFPCRLMPVRRGRQPKIHYLVEAIDEVVATGASGLTDREEERALLAAQSEILGLIAADQPLGETLDRLCLAFEHVAPPAMCSVMLADPDGKRLRSSAGPSLPAEYRAAIDGLPIAPESGCCGTAAWRRQPVVVVDATSDPLLAPFRDLTVKFAIGACWSYPILDNERSVLGSFAIYYDEPRVPAANDWRRIDLMARLARVAIEKDRRAAEMSRQSLLLQTTLDNIDQGLSVFDANLNLVAFNQRALEVMGFPEDFGKVGTPFASLIRYYAEQGEYGPGDVEAQIRERVERAMKFEPHVIERVRPNGTVVEARGRPMPGGGFVTTYTDMTARKRAEIELQRTGAILKEKNRQFDIALDNMTQGLTLYDSDQRLVVANRRYAELYSLPPELLRPGTSLREIMEYSVSIGNYAPEAGAQAVAQRLAAASDGRRRIFHQRLANGRTVEVIHQPLSDGGAVATFTDVSERERTQQALRSSEERLRERIKELEETRRRLENQGEELSRLAANLSRARDEAETASRTKSEFLANMSHELRTPLNAIIGFSEMMKGEIYGPIGDPRYRAYANDVHDSGRHLLALINDILDLSKVEAGRLELHESAVDIADVVVVCERLVHERARHGGVALEVAVATPSPRLFADEIKLKQVLLNLMTNAVKFTPAGGRVTVRAEIAAGGKLQLVVEDTGIGMRQDEIPLALQPFRQVDNAFTRKYPGTGLGLPLAKGLVELHGGELAIASAAEKGTTVTVTLPARRVIADNLPAYAARAQSR